MMFISSLSSTIQLKKVLILTIKRKEFLIKHYSYIKMTLGVTLLVSLQKPHVFIKYI